MKTPAAKTFVASYRIGDFPNAGLKALPWKSAPCKGVLINAYDFIENTRTIRFAKNLLEKEDPLSALEFSGDLILDSGAYYFVRSNSANIDPKAIIDLAVKLGVNQVVTLDHPFPPGLPDDQIQERLKTTLRNTNTMADHLAACQDEKRPVLIPALHGHDFETLQTCYLDQLHLWGENTAKVGLGSLALLAKNGSAGKVAKIIRSARGLIEAKHMHVFSVGSPLLMHFAFACGADSVDSQSWMMSAAFKQAQLPGLAQMRLSHLEREADPVKYDNKRKKFELAVLDLCKTESMALKDWSTGTVVEIRDEADAKSYVDLLEDGPGVNRIHNRACHNLAAATFEAARISDEEANGCLADFLVRRLSKTPYLKAMNEVLEVMAKPP